MAQLLAERAGQAAKGRMLEMRLFETWMRAKSKHQELGKKASEWETEKFASTETREMLEAARVTMTEVGEALLNATAERLKAVVEDLADMRALVDDPVFYPSFVAKE